MYAYLFNVLVPLQIEGLADCSLFNKFLKTLDLKGLGNEVVQMVFLSGISPIALSSVKVKFSSTNDPWLSVTLHIWLVSRDVLFVLILIGLSI